ncbi:MAG TPA: hypothetical protein VGD81_09715 [Opitutaceae bacterium]
MSLKYSAKDWDEVRSAFATSIMVDTSLSSLAQNLDGPDWPLKGKDETPSNYIDLTYDEVVELLALKGQPAARVDELISILKDTLSFDDPFGDMVAQSTASAERDNPVLKNLAKLEIPESFPIVLTAVSPETLEFCRLEKLTTLGEFAVFTQTMSQNVIVGGDFRALLNALSHVDEQMIAKYLPFRPGTKGLHLIEAVAHAVRPLAAEQRARIAKKPAEAPDSLRARVAQLAGQFAAEKEHLRQQVAAGTSPSRLAVVLNDAALEPVVTALLAPHLGAKLPAVAVTGEAPRSGWFSRLFKK